MGNGVQSIFMGLNFWSKGIWGVYERCWDFVGLRKRHRDFFGVLYKFFSSAQINNNKIMHNLLLVGDFGG